MGKYITHEQLPFKGKLAKIRLRNYGFNSVVNQSRNEDELLEITPDGTVKLTATRVDGRQKRKVQIPVDDAEYIFNAFVAVFSEYKKMKVLANSGFWKVRLLTDEDEVFFYHGANGQDFMYEGKTLTEILRERTTLKELNGFAVSIDKESHVSSIDIDFHQTVTEDAAEKVAEKYHAPVEDIVERLIISSRTREIVYNRRVGNNKRVSLSFEMPEAVKDLLAWYEEQPLFEPGEVNPKPATNEGISRTYQITVLYTDKKSASYTGSFDKEGLPGNWADFIGRVAAFFDTESLGEMFNVRTSTGSRQRLTKPFSAALRFSEWLGSGIIDAMTMCVWVMLSLCRLLRRSRIWPGKLSNSGAARQLPSRKSCRKLKMCSTSLGTGMLKITGEAEQKMSVCEIY